MIYMILIIPFLNYIFTHKSTTLYFTIVTIQIMKIKIKITYIFNYITNYNYPCHYCFYNNISFKL